MKRKQIPAAIIVFLFTVLSVLVLISCRKHLNPTDITPEYVINNAPLEAAIRAQINKPSGSLTAGDFNSVTYLNISSTGATSLAGIEKCVNLKMLYMWDNNISDLTPLAGLTALTSLCAMHNHIASVAPLAGLTNLRNLDLAGNDITDISSLAPGCSPAGIGHKEYDSLDLESNPLNATSLSTYASCLAAGAPGVTVNTSVPAYVELVVRDSNDNLVRALKKFASTAGYTFNCDDVIPSGSLSSTAMIQYGVSVGDTIAWDIKDFNGAWPPTGHYKIQIIARTSSDTILLFEKNINHNLIIINSDTCANLHPCDYDTASYSFP